MRVDFINTGY